MINYSLGNIDASEALIKDLYIDLRTKVNAWSEITHQTPQARMGYIGQHLTSVVTGFHGGKSGARGYDLIMDDGNYGEIKTCYRVDQLGSCNNCKAVVSSREKVCSVCGSENINRKNDSKWLINIRNDSEFGKILKPYRYYFVLFEFDDINDEERQDVIASIWEVNPREKGFAFCMIDYYLNIRPKSTSHAAFDMWPHNIKFALTKPKLIYQSVIKQDGSINTNVFPTLNNSFVDELFPLEKYSGAKTLTVDVLFNTIKAFAPNQAVNSRTKNVLIKKLEEIRIDNNISNSDLCDELSSNIYLPLIKNQKDKIPNNIKMLYSELI